MHKVEKHILASVKHSYKWKKKKRQWEATEGF